MLRVLPCFFAFVCLSAAYGYDDSLILLQIAAKELHVDSLEPAKVREVEQPRILFAYDSQAEQSKLDTKLPHMLRSHGYQVDATGRWGRCLVVHGQFAYAADAAGVSCFGISEATAIETQCKELSDASAYLKQRQSYNLVLVWAGLNDLKLASGGGSKYDSNLQQLLQRTRSSCGTTKVLLVPPPLPPFHGAPLGAHPALWPNSKIPEMNDFLNSAVKKAAAQDKLVDFLNLSHVVDAADFDVVGHFCTDGRDCHTSRQLMGAVLGKVGEMLR